MTKLLVFIGDGQKVLFLHLPLMQLPGILLHSELVQLMLPGEVFLPELFLHHLQCFYLILRFLELSLQRMDLGHLLVHL